MFIQPFSGCYMQMDEQTDSAKLSDTFWQLLVVNVLKKSWGTHTIKVKSANYQGKMRYFVLVDFKMRTFNHWKSGF
jgi:hypothetical protein